MVVLLLDRLAVSSDRSDSISVFVTYIDVNKGAMIYVQSLARFARRTVPFIRPISLYIRLR